MNGVEVRLVELIHIAESPLYSAYRWTGRQLGRNVSISEFLRLIDGLVRQEVLYLWSIDQKTQERTRLGAVPDGLAQRYGALSDLDDSFDPFALSLTLGPGADVAAEPEWEVDFDFDRKTFRVNASPGAEEVALQKLGELFPDVELVEERRRSDSSDCIELSGSLSVPKEQHGRR
jgi:hypothetical protein